MGFLDNIVNGIANIGDPLVQFVEKHFKFVIWVPIIIILFFVGKWIGWIKI